MQKKPAVMIMGAGAMGLISGYHLSLAGADVTFLVRPGRFAELQSPQRLYCYNDGKLKEYTQYRAISSLEGFDCAAQDFILVTLDGAVSRTPEASATLRAIGAAIRNSTTTLIFGGVGVGLREHYLDTTGLPSERVLNGVLGLLSYQVARADMPIIPPTQPELISKAYMAYVQFPNQVGFALEGSNADDIAMNATPVHSAPVAQSTLTRSWNKAKARHGAIASASNWIVLAHTIIRLPRKYP